MQHRTASTCSLQSDSSILVKSNYMYIDQRCSWVQNTQMANSRINNSSRVNCYKNF